MNTQHSALPLQPDDVELTTKKTHTAGANPARSRAAKQQASITNDDL
jgi:hypothetical protein